MKVPADGWPYIEGRLMVSGLGSYLVADFDWHSFLLSLSKFLTRWCTQPLLPSIWIMYLVAGRSTDASIICALLPLDEAIASRAVFVIVSASDGRTDRNASGAS